MKSPLLALCSALLLASCAEMHVSRTEIATGAVNPPAIYIRPFSVAYTRFFGYQSGNGAAIRKSLAPAEFANDLQEELCKLAPAMVIQPDETPETGWLVEGEFDVIDAGEAGKRGLPAGTAGYSQSLLKLHVRITDVDRRAKFGDSKASVTTARAGWTKSGAIVYEFDVVGGSRGSGQMGSIYAPGMGNAIPFDFRNAAERIMLALSPDAFRYGLRTSPVRNF